MSSIMGDPIVKKGSSDPVYVEGWGDGDARRVTLRIGFPAPGTTRLSILSPHEARELAIALIRAAEQPQPTAGRRPARPDPVLDRLARAIKNDD